MLLALIMLLASLHPSCWTLTTEHEDQHGPIILYQHIVDDLAVIIYDRPDCR